MTIDEAAAILSDMCRKAPSDQKVVRIHLFGIKYATTIRNKSLAELTTEADIPATYKTEINKGRNFAKFVEVRSSHQ